MHNVKNPRRAHIMHSQALVSPSHALPNDPPYRLVPPPRIIVMAPIPNRRHAHSQAPRPPAKDPKSSPAHAPVATTTNQPSHPPSPNLFPILLGHKHVPQQ
ncbi:hypothetical protein EJ04DRAFT_507365 [Polyplosphaeria fusca]|uniref:Uncharacterized protein n=1 Tax=Polyplosphaeria fusca TaxID=682080 RepID=A0A9P4V919_9PLEO|nr:hypothetical protein EJ04DRAFT_507365 [Polyplosphaeria fusca]